LSSAPAAPPSQPIASPRERQSAARYGLAARGAVITVRQRHGVFGGLSFRVTATPGASSFVFRTARSILAGSGGRLYRIGAWLRTDVPGLDVCLRIQEISEADPLISVRTSEACFTPAAAWHHVRLYRRTLAPGNRLVFSIYSFGATAGDSFEVDNFRVARRVGKGWKRVIAALSKPPDF
jgi:hypothetical protein